MLIQDVLTGRLHEIPDQLYRSYLGEYGHSPRYGVGQVVYDRLGNPVGAVPLLAMLAPLAAKVLPAIATKVAPLVTKVLPMVGNLLPGAAPAAMPAPVQAPAPPVMAPPAPASITPLPPQPVMIQPTGAGFAPSPAMRAYIASVVRDVLAQTGQGANPMFSQGGFRRRRVRRR